MRAPAAALLLLLAAAAFADRETAQFSSTRGDKALAAKKWEEAEGLYRKALEEDETFHPARFGLAQALLGAGKSALAVEELRKFVDDVKTAGPPPEWKTIVAKAEKQLGDLDAAGNALGKITESYVAGLVDLAQRWTSKDAVVAEKALRRVLKLRPGHPKATELLEKMGKSSAGETVELFDGTLKGWEDANAPRWQAVDDELVGTARDLTCGCRTLKSFEGDFDVRCEARVVEDYAGGAIFALMPGWKNGYDHYGLGMGNGKVWWYDETGAGKDRTVVVVAPPDLKKPLDPKQWNTYEFRFRGDEVTALVNGEEIGKEKRPESRKSGFVGLLVQNVKVAFRKIQVEVR